MSIRKVRDLKVYTEAFGLAMKIFSLCESFPKHERYSLSSQIIRSSRSVAANIREGFAKKTYELIFIRHLIDSLGSCEETRCWLEFALSCEYISKEQHNELDKSYASLSAMLYSLQKNWKKIT